MPGVFQNGDRAIRARIAVTAFDLAHQADDDPYVNDPGISPDAPYHHEHVFAECMERLFALQLGVNWQEYDVACAALDIETIDEVE